MYAEDYYVILAVLIVVLLCLVSYRHIRNVRDHDKKTEDPAESGKRIKSDIIGDKTAEPEKADRETKTPAPAAGAKSVRTKEVKAAKDVKVKDVKVKDAKTKDVASESFPRVIYRYFPFAVKEEGEIWVCSCCEVENSSDHKACILCGTHRKDE